MLKYVFFYIKKMFKKKNRVFAQKRFWPWELSLQNMMYLMQLGTSHSHWGAADADTDGCYMWGTGGPQTSGPTHHTPALFPTTNPETPPGTWLRDGSNWCNGHQDLGKTAAKAASHPQALVFIVVDCELS